MKQPLSALLKFSQCVTGEVIVFASTDCSSIQSRRLASASMANAVVRVGSWSGRCSRRVTCLFHTGFELRPRIVEQMVEGGFVDQQANHVQPHDWSQRPVLFEGIVWASKQRTSLSCCVRAFKNSQPSPDTGGFGLATIKEQIEMIRAEIDKTQKNKATNAHIGKLKAKIAQLKIKEEKTAAHSKASGGGKGFEVRKSGDATVAW